MAITAALQPSVIKAAFNKEIDFDSDTIHVMLLGSGYTWSAAHDYINDVVANEIAATGGYTAGGAAVTGKVVSAITNGYAFQAADTVWNPATFSARYAVLYDRTPGTDATRPIIGIVDFGEVVSATNAPFTVDWNAVGAFSLTVTPLA